MPRLTEVLHNVRSCRRKNLNQRPSRPIFRQLLPAELKDKIRGRSERTQGLFVFCCCEFEHAYMLFLLGMSP